MGKKVFIVSYTDYEDDYKHRYDSGVYHHLYGVYSTLKKAEEAEQKIKVDFINENSEQMDEDDPFMKYFEKSEYDYKLMKKYEDNEKIVDKIYDKWNKGEYVDYQQEIDIDEQLLD
jgi:hypothetical protein